MSFVFVGDHPVRAYAVKKEPKKKVKLFMPVSKSMGDSFMDRRVFDVACAKNPTSVLVSYDGQYGSKYLRCFLTAVRFDFAVGERINMELTFSYFKRIKVNCMNIYPTYDPVPARVLTWDCFGEFLDRLCANPR